jgi:hypothetical protein
MKVRNGFISNSSSSSFIVCVRFIYDSFNNSNKLLIDKKSIKNLLIMDFRNVIGQVQYHCILMKICY